MQVDDRLGTFETVADAAAPDLAATLVAVRAMVAELHPDAMEFASTRERSVSWGYGQSKMKTWYAYAMPHAAHVNLGFFQGIHLPDPDHLLEGTGKVLRHLKLKPAADPQHPGVRALLVAARDERRCALAID